MIRQWPDPCLTVASTPYTEIEMMLAQEHGQQLLRVLEKYKRRGIGLAAPQIGINRRVFALDKTYLRIEHGPIFVNPTLMWQSQDTSVEEEGCLSFPAEVMVEVRRPVSISASYEHPDRGLVMCELHDLPARAFLHEMDHLDSITLLDYLPRQQRRKLQRQIEKKVVR